MGTRRQRQRQEELWYRQDLAQAPGHPFYRRLNEVLDEAGFDEFCEGRCQKFYHEKLGRPSLAPVMYFRVMLIGFFEGIESERGIAWRVADSLCLRQFLQIGLDERTPDHVTISRTPADGRGHASGGFWLGAAASNAGGIVERKDDRHRRHYAGSQRCDEVDCSAQRRLIGSFQPGRLRQPLQVLGVALRRIAAHGSATQEEGLE